MSNLAEKYRPQSFDTIYGQEKAVDAIQRHLSSGSNQSMLFVGPSGTGKTTAARIAGASWACETSAPKACGFCSTCKAILVEGRRFAFGWHELDGGRFNEKENMGDVAGLLAGDTQWRWSAFIDEIHALTGPAADALLKAVENPVPTSFFIAASTDLLAIRPALRKRCHIIDFAPLSGSNMFALLKNVCGKEGIRFEPTALDMIGSASAGSAREALIKLDQVSSQGDVTTSSVADTLAFGNKSHVIGYFDAVVAADGNAQDAALYNWQAEPVEKGKMIRDYLLHVYNFEVATPALSQMVNPAFYTVTSDERLRLVEGVRARSGTRALPDYWLDLLQPWEFAPGTLSDEVALSIKVRRFDRLLNPDGPSAAIEPLIQAAPSRKRVRAYRARSRKLRVTAGRGVEQPNDRAYIAMSQAEAIYAIGTFLPQQHGLLFNTRIRFNHRLLGRDDEGEVAKLVSDLTHELAARSGPLDSVHWMYVNGNGPNGLFTEMVLHIPPPALAAIGEWLRPRIGTLCGMALVDEQAMEYDAPHVSRATGWQKRRVERHWWLIRRLLGGMHPEIGFPAATGRVTPLLDLLKVKRGWRGPVGELSSLRRFSCSGSLGPKVRSAAAKYKMKFLSALIDNAWDHFDSGWELQEHADRREEQIARQDAVARVELEWPNSDSVIEKDNRAKALAKLYESWPEDARKRRRSWSGWWT